MEACWAHNPEVRRSKLRSASSQPFTTNGSSSAARVKLSFLVSVKEQVPLAQRIARWTSNPKVLGSIPRWDDTFFVKSAECKMIPFNYAASQTSGWPSGLRRQTQGSIFAPW